ncbi:MAG TPA: hypothetical protein VLS88_18220 [Polyangiales bacterium]|nr:hypothetical protein [Polyangiales bacterium]
MSLLGLVLWCAAGSTRAEDGQDRVALDALQARLEELETRDEANHARGAIEQAREALRVASDPTEDPAAASRAQDIARAAVVLAGRQLDRQHSQAELFAARRRLDATRARAEAQRRALEALLRERASIARAREQR